MGGHQRGGRVEIAASECVTDRLAKVAPRFEPRTGPPVKHGPPFAVPAAELLVQGLGEQVVIAEPLTPVVERDEEEVLVLELGEDTRRVGPSSDDITERPAQSLQDRRLHEKGAKLVALLLQHHFHQVVDH
jgi:hypothetical protein